MYGYNAQQAYGSLPGPLKKNEPKVTLPFQAVFLSWLIPTAVFAVVSGAASSSLVTYYPFLIYGILAVVTAGSLLTLHIVLIVLRRYFSGKSKVFPFWYAFLGVALTSAVVASLLFAHMNYMKNEIASDTLKRLATATNVDPAVDSTSRYLDVGRVVFAPGTGLDVAKSIGFKNKDVYCVAPIVNPNASKAPASYDYWAVGLNCCDADGFRCGEYLKPNARSGVRLMNEEQREFYMLAVHEAEATFGIKSSMPLFFFWVEDAAALQRSWEVKTFQYWALATLTFAAFLFAATVAGVAFFEAFLATW
ncbi:unnamed protein product [Durusdinium trenchii]|uniref:Uncharacterized protein n=1 Tax=Durusdinium trenchii TaxID=1381693 RepID=A0ABP0NQQ4_9DINO